MLVGIAGRTQAVALVQPFDVPVMGAAVPVLLSAVVVDLVVVRLDVESVREKVAGLVLEVLEVVELRNGRMHAASVRTARAAVRTSQDRSVFGQRRIDVLDP